MMKAAVITKFGETPRYEDFPGPIPGNDETLVQVKAAVLENFDKMAANGTHYSSIKMFPKFPAIVGHSGIGTAPDGKLVGFGMVGPPYGAFSEQTLAKHFIAIPDGIDVAMAAALPPSVLTSFLPLKYTAKLQPGETVLVNGATGVSGKIAVQVAKLLGAGKIIGTGRDETSLLLLKGLGADAVIDLKQPGEKLLEAFKEEAGESGYNVVIDFLWGHPAEILMRSFIPTIAGFAKRRTRYLHIGEKAGPGVNITGEMLRTSGLEIYGGGPIAPEEFSGAMKQTWEWIKENRFVIDIEKVPLADIEQAWQRNDLAGKRLVIIP
jgi:NADPH:quinone reductase-like Zn-dependent oxidoreductase